MHENTTDASQRKPINLQDKINQIVIIKAKLPLGDLSPQQLEPTLYQSVPITAIVYIEAK